MENRDNNASNGMKRFKRVVGLIVFCLAASLLLTPLTQASNTTLVLNAQLVGPNNSQRVGPTNRQQVLTLAISLKLDDQSGFEHFISALYDPTSSQYKHYLTPQEFTQRFLDPASRAQLISFLKNAGLTVTDSGQGVIVNASGTVAQIERIFQVSISDYRDARTGRVFFGNASAPVLPSALAAHVQTVAGLSNYTQAQPRFNKSDPKNAQPRSGTPSGCPAAVSAANNFGAFTPNQFKTAYNFDPLYNQNINGAGQTVAVYELDDYVDANVAAYQSCFGTNVPLQRVLVDGGISQIGGGQSEVELDIEVVAGLAPGLSKILVYEDPGNTIAQYLNEFQRIANDNLAQVVSISWGYCEGDTADITTGVLDTENAIFGQMAAQGQSVFSASGDYGAQGCLPITGSTALSASDILDTQYVTGVGGTRLTLNSNNTINAEVTWNDYNNQRFGASAGGLSTYFARPSWQVGPGTDNSYTNGKRMTPDVSAAASPYTAYVVYTGDNGSAGSWGAIGGTSASSPLWAAAAALTNQYLTKHGLPVLGFANPTIYRIYNSPTSSAVYHDITVGDNCYDPSCGTPNSGTATYPATTGYDMATGIGTLNAFNFVRNTVGCSTSSTIVSNSADDGSSGSLRSALNSANGSATACKVVDLTSPAIGATITLNSAQGSGLTVGAGVTLLGPLCTNNGPALTISGLNINGDGLLLNGGTVTGLKITQFGGRQIVGIGSGNQLGCIKASKN